MEGLQRFYPGHAHQATLANDDNIRVSLTTDVATHDVLSRAAEKRLDIAWRHRGDTLATDLSTIATL